MSASKVTRIEGARSKVTWEDAWRLLHCYGAPPDDVEELRQMIAGPAEIHAAVSRRLQELRNRCVMSRKQAAQATGLTPSKVEYIERPESTVTWEDAERLLRCYRASASVGEEIRRKITEASRTGWWHSFRDVIPVWMSKTIATEGVAERIREWHPTLIPPMLRTGAYQEAIWHTMSPDQSPEKISRRVELLLERQRRVLESSCTIWEIMGAGALETLVGGEELMREQIAHLRALGQRPDVRVQVAPRGLHPLSTTPPVRLLRTGAGSPDQFVLAQGADRAEISDRKEMVDQYMADMNGTAVLASRPGALLEQLEGIWA
ncbi:hypothetical protein AN218_22900 [Streptomyces nanshensis]|uniref:DUF5753 domain-containing protein n=2 Tax=Streptomyces nanshensis TaxID=518642 RepID=A0A1E7KZR0_9ACTN|nr:hypothetical protein AN218_22900 [Streptomyces nanshensis]